MAIRTLVFIFLLLPSCVFSQNIDSLETIYRQYHNTSLLKASPSGKYVILNHVNAYGKDEDELFDLKIGKGKLLDKAINYQFLGDEMLLSQNIKGSRFENLKTLEHREVLGAYTPAVITQAGEVLLHSVLAKELVLTSMDGNVLWKSSNINAYRFDNKNNRLIYSSGEQLVVRDLKNKQTKSYKIDSGSQWITLQDSRIYCAKIEASQLHLYTLDLLSNQFTKQFIKSPEAFEFAFGLVGYFEIRADGHFMFPLYLKDKLNVKENSGLKITYSNRNSRDKYLNHHLGIFNLKEDRWDYLPDSQQKLPIYKFLNDRGDFVVYDQSGDIVEEQQNVVLDLKLFLDYGKSSYLLPKKRVTDGNYLWDRGTEQFIYFDQKRWRCRHIKNGTDHELLPLDTHGWDSNEHNGLGHVPEVNPIHIKGSSAIMLSNQYDYFIVDLKTHRLERITMGQEQQTKYRLELSKDQYPRSSWNIKFAEVDMDRKLTFKLLNLETYNSGFAVYSHKNNKTTLYQQGHYREMISYKAGLFLTSHFALEPFRLTNFEKGNYTVVYESLKERKKDLKGTGYQIFQYETHYGKANAVLLFPTGYDEHKKYPMIVNVYEKQSLTVLNFISPNMSCRDGFNYMNYLMNGYIVLLPDLQYETANFKNSMITSLEKSIDAAKLIAPIDEKNIGILGLSHGGYETGLALTNSNYFKTGIAGVGVFNLVLKALSNSEITPSPNYWRTENQQSLMRDNVFDNWSNYLENSPIYHLKKLESPMLIWVGSKDPNVSPAHSKMFFLGVKRLRKKAVLLEYVNETHTIGSKPNQLDLNVKISQWFDYYLKGKTPAEWISPVIN